MSENIPSSPDLQHFPALPEEIKFDPNTEAHIRNSAKSIFNTLNNSDTILYKVAHREIQDPN